MCFVHYSLIKTRIGCCTFDANRYFHNFTAQRNNASAVLGVVFCPSVRHTRAYT